MNAIHYIYYTMILIIDMGYLLFYRYHATNIWLRHQKDWKTSDTIPSEVVYDFFEKHLRSQLDKLKKKYKTARKIYFCKDTPQANIWRKEIYPAYKATRGTADDIIRHLHEILSRVIIEYGQIVGVDKLEADDIAYLLVQRIRRIHQEEDIVIITSDHDYLQLTDDHITIINGSGKEVKGTGNAQIDMYTKILMGDVSDNIPPICKGCGKKTAQKLASDENERLLFIEKNGCQKEYERNAILICMANIPPQLIQCFEIAYPDNVLGI